MRSSIARCAVRAAAVTSYFLTNGCSFCFPHTAETAAALIAAIFGSAVAARGATWPETWSYQQRRRKTTSSQRRTDARRVRGRRGVKRRVAYRYSRLAETVRTSVFLYVDCAPIRAPIILPTRFERHCRLARETDGVVAAGGADGRARRREASGRGLRPREAPGSRDGWSRAES